MIVGFIGDVHGRVLHAIAALTTWQMQTGQQFDLVLQVGDLGAYPNLADLDPVDPEKYPHLALDPSEADFSRLLRAEGHRAEALRHIRKHLRSPIYFVRGNHEDFDWLQHLHVDEASGTAPVDPFDFFRYVPDGRVLRFGELRIACLGGAGPTIDDDSQETTAEEIDRNAYRTLMNLDVGNVDVLVTHDAPYGISVGYHGQIQGSMLISNVVEQIQPSFHVSGHLGLHGPHIFDRTTYLCLNELVASVRWHPGARGLQQGCLVVLDTSVGNLMPVADSWLARFPTPFRFDEWAKQVITP